MMKSSKPNIKIEYLYRDAGNFKLFEQVIFANPDCIPLEQVKNGIQENLVEEEFFYPDQWDLPMPRFEKYIPHLDHDLCELIEISRSSKDPTTDGTVKEFLNRIMQIRSA